MRSHLSSKSISLVIPIYNEAKIIKKSLFKLIKYLKEEKAFKNFEIILVDNGSTDNSFQEITQLAKHPQISALRTKKRGLGIGKALKRGLKQTHCENILFYAIDLPFGLSFIQEVLKLASSGYDLILGSKGHSNSQLDNINKNRIIINRVYNWLIRKLFCIEIKDTQGAFLIKKSLLKEINRFINSDGPWFQAQLVIYSQLNKARIKEIPIRVSKQLRKSNYGIQDGLIFFMEMIKELPKYYWHSRKKLLSKK